MRTALVERSTLCVSCLCHRASCCHPLCSLHTARRPPRPLCRCAGLRVPPRSSFAAGCSPPRPDLRPPSAPVISSPLPPGHSLPSSSLDLSSAALTPAAFLLRFPSPPRRPLLDATTHYATAFRTTPTSTTPLVHSPSGRSAPSQLDVNKHPSPYPHLHTHTLSLFAVPLCVFAVSFIPSLISCCLLCAYLTPKQTFTQRSANPPPAT